MMTVQKTMKSNRITEKDNSSGNNLNQGDSTSNEDKNNED